MRSSWRRAATGRLGRRANATDSRNVNPMLCAVVTAGGRVDEAFAAAIGTPVKALAPFGGGVLLDAVLAAIRGAGIPDIAVVGGRELEPPRGAARLIPAAPDGATNISRALDAWPAGDDLLFATCDLPFATAA